MTPPTLRRSAAAALAAAALMLPLLASTPAAGTPAAGAHTDRAAAGAAAPQPRWEVWQQRERPHRANRTNPLANRIWGVYEGPQDQAWAPYRDAAGKRKRLLARIALRPRTKWYGDFVADRDIRRTVSDYVTASQDGNPGALVQMAVFRMEPWEHAACRRPPTRRERSSYRRWIRNLAAGIGDAHTLVVMQPDGPFLWCVPRPRLTARLLTWATRTLSALPNTSVYIDAGAADWCENEKAPDPGRCAGILERTGIRYARGFALDSTHYTGPSDNIRHGSAIVDILARDGYGRKHFIIDTAKSGRPMRWSEVIPSAPGELKNNARTCKTRRMRRCVTLGIPPTVRVADRAWGLGAADRRLAARNVDGFVWFGRPWLYNQATPFQAARALAMARTTPWPGPCRGTPVRAVRR